MDPLPGKAYGLGPLEWRSGEVLTFRWGWGISGTLDLSDHPPHLENGTSHLVLPLKHLQRKNSVSTHFPAPFHALIYLDTGEQLTLPVATACPC